MIGATLTYSPGYQVPLWLGPAQLRLWRRIDRTLAGRPHVRTTVRALAAELGANPGTISRDLDALGRLGFAVHLATWGRAGVTLWRVVSRGGRKGLDPYRQRRALARMGVSRVAPGQLALATIEAVTPAYPPDAGSPPTGSAGRYLAEPVNPAPVLGDGPPNGADAGTAEPGDAPAPFGTITCECGRTRLVAVGREPSACPHPPTTRSTLGLDS